MFSITAIPNKMVSTSPDASVGLNPATRGYIDRCSVVEPLLLHARDDHRFSPQTVRNTLPDCPRPPTIRHAELAAQARRAHNRQRHPKATNVESDKKLKNRCPKGRVGSSPTLGTKVKRSFCDCHSPHSLTRSAGSPQLRSLRRPSRRPLCPDHPGTDARRGPGSESPSCARASAERP